MEIEIRDLVIDIHLKAKCNKKSSPIVEILKVKCYDLDSEIVYPYPTSMQMRRHLWLKDVTSVVSDTDCEYEPFEPKLKLVYLCTKLCLVLSRHLIMSSYYLCTSARISPIHIVYTSYYIHFRRRGKFCEEAWIKCPVYN